MTDASVPIDSAGVPSTPAGAGALPVGALGKRALGWWGLMAMIATETALFAYLLFTYYYLASQATHAWPPDGLPKLLLGSINTAILVSSSVMVWASEWNVKRANKLRAMLFMAAGIVLGAIFIVIQIREWSSRPYGIATNLYGSVYFTITGFHMFHVLVGLFVLAFLLLWIGLGFMDKDRYAALTIGGVYWHFVDVVWLFVFTTFYLTPYF